MDILLYNPIAMMFLSFTVGALLTPSVLRTSFGDYLANLNVLSDVWTKRLGILILGWIIVNTPLRFFNQEVYLKSDRSAEGLMKIIAALNKAAVGHLIAFDALLLCGFYLIYRDGDWDYFFILLAVNIVSNLYVAFLLQYQRRRVQRLVD